jgi:hypothetical protein
VSWANVTKFVATVGKFDAEGTARCVNVEADYPAEPAYLQTLSRWSETSAEPDQRFRDGYDLYCFRRIVERHSRFEYAVLLREDPIDPSANMSELVAGMEGNLFRTFVQDFRSDTASSNLIVELRNPLIPAFLEIASDLYRSGAVYGMADYSLESALRVALGALEAEQAQASVVEDAPEEETATASSATAEESQPFERSAD